MHPRLAFLVDRVTNDGKTVGHLDSMVAHSKRSDIVDKGLELVHRNGFTSTGVAAIAAAGGAPKGSFYNHFKSKEDFALAILTLYFSEIRSKLTEILDDRGQSPRNRIRNYFLLLHGMGVHDEFARGCLIGNLSVELAPANHAVRPCLAELLKEWALLLSRPIAEAQDAGEVRNDISATVLAAVIIDAWQGALLRAKVERRPDSLDAFLGILLPALLTEPSQ